MRPFCRCKHMHTQSLHHMSCMHIHYICTYVKLIKHLNSVKFSELALSAHFTLLLQVTVVPVCKVHDQVQVPILCGNSSRSTGPGLQSERGIVQNVNLIPNTCIYACN